MNAVDYIYRFDPGNPTAKPSPRDADTARRLLEDGNRKFSQWMEGRRTGTASIGDPPYVLACNGLEAGMAKQAPFAVVVGCSDARVPVELLFGQGFNDLFVIRVAGNVLGDVCMGSIDFALNRMSDSVRVVVMLGHSGCGAVAGAVDSYLNPVAFWSKSITPMLRSLIQRIFASVLVAVDGFEQVWGLKAADVPGYREALIESSVCINAAQSAYQLRQEVERLGKREIEVLYGVHNIRTHQVSMPVDPSAPRSDGNVRLAHAPSEPLEFHALAVRLAELLKPKSHV